MMGSKYCVTWVSSVSEVPAELWNAGFRPPLAGRWWYETLEKSRLEDQFTFLYAMILDCGRPIGLAPAFVMNVPIALVVPPEVLPVFTLAGKFIPAILHQRTLFVGSPCSEEGTIGFLPDTGGRTALLCLQEALEKKAREMRAPMLVWKDFPSGFSADLDWLGAQAVLFRLVSFPGTLVNLSSRKKDDYYAAMKASRRQKIKRKLRRSVEAVEIAAEVIQQPDEATLSEIFSLFGQTYAKATTRFERLNRTFFEIIAKVPASNFILLREKVTGKMLAFMLCFDVGDRLINKFIGIDYSRPKDWVLYFRLWDAAVDWALEKGFSSIQSGQTGYSAKIELGNRLVPLTNYCRHSNKIVHAIYRFAAKGIDWHTLDADLAAHLKAHPEDAGLSRRREPHQPYRAAIQARGQKLLRHLF